MKNWFCKLNQQLQYLNNHRQNFDDFSTNLQYFFMSLGVCCLRWHRMFNGKQVFHYDYDFFEHCQSFILFSSVKNVSRFDETNLGNCQRRNAPTNFTQFRVQSQTNSILLNWYFQVAKIIFFVYLVQRFLINFSVDIFYFEFLNF